MSLRSAFAMPPVLSYPKLEPPCEPAIRRRAPCVTTSSRRGAHPGGVARCAWAHRREGQRGELADQIAAAPTHPRRVVCLTEETTETLYRIGAGELVVGVSGFTVRPPEARRKPRVSSFLSADTDAILALRPDLVVGFSDLQADIARDLVRRGVPVLVTNQRSVAEILQTLRLVTAAVGRAEAGAALADELAAGLARVADAAASLPRRPRVFFEEWPEPLISGIRWVSELLELCGGEDVCAESRASHAAAGRIFEPAEVARRAPEVVIASWCGRRRAGR